ncbi:MAG: tetratricopeptide repeat protein, partial [Gammaproteobacteria bacterium]
LEASAQVNLLHVYGSLGRVQDALRASREALPVMTRLGNRLGLAKIQWGIGALLRGQGSRSGAIEAFRSAQSEFSAAGLLADAAASGLVIADLLLELGEETAAANEIVSALPLIEKYKLVPEGMAALALLRESVRQQKVHHQALRDLHGFFEETVS